MGMVNSTLRLLYRKGKSLQPLDMRLGGAQFGELPFAPRPVDAGLQGNISKAPSIPKAPYTLSAKLSDFTV